MALNAIIINIFKWFHTIIIPLVMFVINIKYNNLSKQLNNLCKLNEFVI